MATSNPDRAVVLAAGMGTRLADSYPEPKPLVEVDGVPLAIRTLESLRRAGVRQVGMVVGYQAERVRWAVESRVPAGLELTFVDNPDWEEPNGLSLRVAEAFSGEHDFVLTMVDHIFDPRIVQRLRALPARPGVTLAVDRDVERVFDLDDATKVVLDEAGQIQAIGKELGTYNAIDCGLFRCSAEIYPALDQAFASGSHSVSGGMQVLASRGQFRGMAVEGLYWQDVDTPEMLGEAERWSQHRRTKGTDELVAARL